MTPPLGQRSRLLGDEARRAPTARALGIGLLAGAAAPAAGLAAGLVAREVLRTAAAGDRLARNAADAASLAARLGPHCPPLDGWAAAADFCELLVREVATRRPEVVVELGSGVSTLAVGEAPTACGRWPRAARRWWWSSVRASRRWPWPRRCPRRDPAGCSGSSTPGTARRSPAGASSGPAGPAPWSSSSPRCARSASAAGPSRGT